MATPTLAVSEVFGPTVQGEGPYTGRVCGFIRLGACNLTCTWCDTPYTWDANRFNLREEITRIPVDQLVAEVEAMAVPLVVLSGGEPLLQQRHEPFVSLLRDLDKRRITTHVETNGTLTPSDASRALIDHFTVSPKLGNSGVPLLKRIRPDAMTAYTTLANNGRAIFKFVARSPHDLNEIDELAEMFQILPDTIWVMGEGTTSHTTLTHTRAIAPAVIDRRWNLTTRLHTLIWETKRGT